MFLPTSIKEVRERGWEQLDVILFTGDAYIDHPAFGAAVIGRLLEAEGYRVAIVPQPNWRDDLRDFTKLGAPRLFFGVTAGAMDSMVNHYTANLRLRHDDAYTPGGKASFRPDRAVTVYTQILKRLFPHVPVVIGGIEASLRRLTHYDYWSDSLHPSVLVSSGADLLIYGMGEGVIQEVAQAMRNGYNAKLLRKIRQVAFLADRAYVDRLDPAKTVRLHSFERCQTDKRAFGENFVHIETQSNLMQPDATLVEEVGDRFVVVTPPHATLTTEELDHSFDLPYERAPHPRYRGKGPIPAWEMIRFSVNIHRGCFGGCAFCTISAHQGKFIHSRSERSILAEVERIVRMPDFKGYLSDVGAPSANMYRMGGRDKSLCGRCRRPSCLHPTRCPNLVLQILDFFHLSENVYSYGKAKFKMNESQYIPWADEKCKKLRDGKWKEVLGELDPEETYKNTVNLYHYINSNKEHIDYPQYSAMGLFIGSGAIESSIKIIVQRRFKQAGMRWGVSTAQYLMTLVSKWESELWESDVVNRTYKILN